MIFLRYAYHGPEALYDPCLGVRASTLLFVHPELYVRSLAAPRGILLTNEWLEELWQGASEWVGC